MCSSCLSYFVSRTRYDTHIWLRKRNGTQYVFPEVHAPKLQLSSFNSMVNAPFVIYADLETIYMHEVCVNKDKTVSRHKLIPVFVGTLTVCQD